MSVNADLNLRAMTKADWPLMEKWLKKEHVRRWLGQPENWLSEIREANGDPSAWVRHYVAQLGSEPIGFAQAYECARTEPGLPWQDEPPGTYGIDYFIGELKYMGLGLGNELVKLICGQLPENAWHVIADPDPDNTRSIRVLKKSGFVLDPDNGLYKRAIKDSIFLYLKNKDIVV